MPSVCEWAWLGLVDYAEAWDLQRDLTLRRALNEVPDTLILLEHRPVFTTGRRDASANLRLPEAMLGAPLVETDRGGDITFHGPGQLVAYPIVDLKAAGLSVVDYVRGLEHAVIDTLASYGIEAGAICRLTGVWVGDEKIAAIGVRVSRPAGGSGAWVTSHGLALNVSVDLTWFDRIVPCGIPDKGVTSMAALVPSCPSLRTVSEQLAASFGHVFGRTMCETRRLPLARIT
jgi:lipoyl(octanoyl) transferase